MRKSLFSKIISFTLISCFALCCVAGLVACGTKEKEATLLENVDDVIYSTYDGKTAFVSGEFDSYGEVTIKNECKGLPVTSIGKEAFNRNTQITKLIIEDGITEIGENAFYDCSRLEEVVLPESLIKIDENAFCGCEALKGITFPKDLQVIGESAFGRCEKIESVTIPDSVEILGGFVFDLCFAIKTFTVEGDITSVGKAPTWKIESATIPASLAGWMSGANETVKTVVITCGTDIQEEAFKDCTALESVEVAATVKRIGKNAFKGCDNLKTVDFKDSNNWTVLQDQTQIHGTPATPDVNNLVKKYCDYEWSCSK